MAALASVMGAAVVCTALVVFSVFDIHVTSIKLSLKLYFHQSPCALKSLALNSSNSIYYIKNIRSRKESTENYCQKRLL